MKINFSVPDVGIMEAKQVVDVLRSGWITTGFKVKEMKGRLQLFVAWIVWYVLVQRLHMTK